MAFDEKAVETTRMRMVWLGFAGKVSRTSLKVAKRVEGSFDSRSKKDGM